MVTQEETYFLPPAVSIIVGWSSRSCWAACKSEVCQPLGRSRFGFGGGGRRRLSGGRPCSPEQPDGEEEASSNAKKFGKYFSKRAIQRKKNTDRSHGWSYADFVLV